MKGAVESSLNKQGFIFFEGIDRMIEKFIIGQNNFLDVLTTSLRVELEDFLSISSHKKNVGKYHTIYE